MRTKLKIHSLAQPDFCARAKGNLNISLSADKKRRRWRVSQKRQGPADPEPRAPSTPAPIFPLPRASIDMWRQHAFMLTWRRRDGRTRTWQLPAPPRVDGRGPWLRWADARSAPPRSPFGSPPLVSSRTKNFRDFKLRAIKSIRDAPTPIRAAGAARGRRPRRKSVSAFFGADATVAARRAPQKLPNFDSVVGVWHLTRVVVREPPPSSER